MRRPSPRWSSGTARWSCASAATGWATRTTPRTPAQATFLVLARKARSIRQSEAVAGWLFGVAGRVSARVRATDRRRMRAEQKAGMSPDLATEDQPPESWTELYEELDRLPEKYRLPLVLCYLEGLTYEQAAAQLRCPVRTIQSRLARDASDCAGSWSAADWHRRPP